MCPKKHVSDRDAQWRHLPKTIKHGGDAALCQITLTIGFVSLCLCHRSERRWTSVHGGPESSHLRDTTSDVWDAGRCDEHIKSFVRGAWCLAPRGAGDDRLMSGDPSCARYYASISMRLIPVLLYARVHVSASVSWWSDICPPTPRTPRKPLGIQPLRTISWNSLVKSIKTEGWQNCKCSRVKPTASEINIPDICLAGIGLGFRVEGYGCCCQR